VNHSLNANLTIDAGAGNDVVNTLGAGDWKITLGAGNDTYYADNTAGKAQWVFNTADQTSANADERKINDLVSSANTPYRFLGNGFHLRVTYRDVSSNDGVFESAIIDIPGLANGSLTDLQINQAIKLAINGDPVLSKLLVATDGPANTLVVTALSDGGHVVTDLDITFSRTTAEAADFTAIQSAVESAGTAAITAFWTALGGIGSLDTWKADTTLALWNSYLGNQLITLNSAADYDAAFAQTDSNFDIAGGFSQLYASDNIINSGAGNDVIVLSTGILSNDTLKWTELGNGNDTIVNFEQLGSGAGWQPAILKIDLSDVVATNPSTDLGITITGGTGNYTSGNAGIVDLTDVDDIGTYLETLSYGSNWNPSYDAATNVLTLTSLTQSATGWTPSNVQLTTTTGSDITINLVFSSDVEVVTDAWEASLGIDQLDFTSYGVVAAYLSNTYTPTGFVPLATVGNAAGTLDNGHIGTYTGGAKYITLEQVNTAAPNAHLVGKYEIVLWQDNQGTLGSNGVGVAEFDATGTHDTNLGVIGYVDFGQQLSTAYFVAADVHI
jgi:hypothetical protein